ncbi:MAG: phosphodiesterase [Pseudomonadota bacterium]
MQKVLVFTDLHIVPEGETIIGLDPAERLAQGLDHALARHSDAAAIILTGDLTHHGAPEEYNRLKTVLSRCPLPLTMTLGNHDIRSAFRKVFPEAVPNEGFAQHLIDLQDTRLIILDTLDEKPPVLHSGWLCQERLHWLDCALREAIGQRVVLFMHHPPAATGFPNMDAIALREPERLARVLRSHPNVVQIVAGHVHRTCQTSLKLEDGRRVPVTIFKSTCHQMPMDLLAENPHLSVDEPGAYGVLLLRDDGVIVHTEDFTLPTRIRDSYGE